MGFETAAKRGVVTHYGPRVTDEKFGAQYGSKDPVRTVEWTFDYNDLPAGATHNLGYSIPANARVLSAKFEVIEAFTSTSTTSDLLVGLETSANVEIDYDGFLTAVNLDQAVIANVGSVTAGTGALVGDTIGAAAGELYVAPSVADLLTGRARVIVEYIVAGV